MFAIKNAGATAAAPEPTAAAAPQATAANNQKAALADLKTPDMKGQTLQSEHYFSRDPFFGTTGKSNKKRRNSAVTMGKVTYTLKSGIADDFRSIRFFSPPATESQYPALCVKTSPPKLSPPQKANWTREAKHFNTAYPGAAKLFFNALQKSYRLHMHNFGTTNLKQAIDAAKSLSEKIDIYIKMFEELDRIHNLGIMHGDVKYPNIIINNGKVYFIDFEFSQSIGDNYPTFANDIRARIKLDVIELWMAAGDDRATAQTKLLDFEKSDGFTRTFTHHINTFAGSCIAPECFSNFNLTAQANRDVYSACTMVTALTEELTAHLQTGLVEDPEKRPSTKQLIAILKQLRNEPSAAQSAAAPKLG